MKYYSLFTSCFVMLSSLFLSSACDMISSDTSYNQAQIKFVQSGGFSGGIRRKLNITADGLVTNELTIPKLEKQLSPEEYADLLALFKGFFELPSTFEGPTCSDDVRSEVTLNTTDRDEKTVSIWGCILFEQKDTDQNVKKMNRIISALSKLADTVFEEKALWVGLKGDFFLDSDTYGIGETITMTYPITNPTAKERTLFFADEHKTGFTVRKPALPNFMYRFPPASFDDTPPSDDLQTLVFAPGEEIVLTRQWDQVMRDIDEMNGSLEPGRYVMSLRVLDTGRLLYTAADILFDVVDRSIPLAGHVQPDYNGSVPENTSYTFKLAVRNWSDNPVTLDFPYWQTLGVRLYDLNGPGNQPPLIFEGPRNLGDGGRWITLQPEETHVFKYTVPKDSLNLSYLWYLAEIDLLVTNFDFGRKAQLRILER